ncbi:Tripartite tricarboxylate transporter family receptor [Pigmentiphaga humi]|uniref:Tripartite tricarboxylate transporter family receptor n=1 Tax=Pigmentiphaga humi TaxID=2478468 RepID=A0A3P4AZV4_9BURK|nr:tripartite tricarboxylate transporter substrate binding protein [Pigmentiphaga humi]VCU69101.1 Tripartite tricarboxylate transporter family receptor [Pigmentiphaga humi]
MNRMTSLIKSAAVAAFALGCSVSAAQQPYPSKPVRVVVPYAPGGAGDLVSRIVTRKVGEIMGQAFVVDNRPGAGAIAASEAVAKAEPDGYTILLTGNNFAINRALFKSLPNDVMNDFNHISTLAFFEMVMVVADDSPFKTVQDVLDYARANPGKLNIGSINVGSTQQLAAVLFQTAAGIQAQVVPYRSSAEVISALRSKDVQVGMELMPPVMGQLSSGALRAIGVASLKRSPLLPQVPTIDQSGVPGYEASSWNGLSAPPGTPPEVVASLQKAIARAIADPEVSQKLVAAGTVPRAGTSEQIRDQLNSDYTKWKKVIEQANIPLQ